MLVLVVTVSRAASDSDDVSPPARTAAPAGITAGSRLGPGHLARGSNATVLPGNVLIADRANNRLLIVTPRGQVAWQFPRRGDLRRRQTFKVPDDAFFTPDGRRIVATQEDNFVVSVIDVARHRIVYRYGTPGAHGAAANHLYNPDDAIMMRNGDLLSADIKNCRLIVVHPPSHRVARQFGQTGHCLHAPPLSYTSPNGAFPTRSGGTVITEINGDWVDLLDPAGRLLGATHAPGFSYPSDTNEVRPGVLLSADYVKRGAVETFDFSGRLLWRYGPRPGRGTLNRPSLALPLPNGDILVNDDYNHRVVVIDPNLNRIVWQYGHTRHRGHAPGYLNIPDGVDLAPPHSLASRFPALAAPGSQAAPSVKGR